MTLVFTSGPGTFGVSTPPPFDPIVISGITLGAAATTSQPISWNVAPGAQGQVQYGLTGAFGSATALETGFLTSHAQTLAGLAPATTYYYRIRAISATGIEVFSTTLTFTTAANTSGITWSQIVDWPTGPGYTSGSAATVRANLQALVTGKSGTSPTNRVLHRIPAGAVYTIDRWLSCLGISFVTFDGSGTETTYGHTGGATIRCNATAFSPYFVESSVISSGYGAFPTMDDVRFHALTIEGAAPATGDGAYASGTAGNGGEYQMGFALFATRKIEIDHCIIDKVKGDGVYPACQQGGGAPTLRNVWCVDTFVHHSVMSRIGRMGIGLIAADGLRCEDNDIFDMAYAPFDVEPDVAGEGARNLVFDRNRIGNWGWDPDFGVGMVNIVGVAGTSLSGTFDMHDNLITGRNQQSATANYAWLQAHLPSGIDKSGVVFDITGNVLTGTRHAGAAMYFAGCSSNGHVITNNTGFLLSGSFVSASGMGTRTEFGNT